MGSVGQNSKPDRQALCENGGPSSVPNLLSRLKDNGHYNLRERTSGLSRDEKTDIRSKAGGTCWLCGLRSQLQVAHMIEEAEIDLFRSHRERGFHKMRNIHVPENLICLCPNCHTSYDARTPAWIFLPVNLAEFLEEEEQFQRDRVSAAERGVALRRKPSTKMASKYRRYQTREHFVPTEIFKKNPVEVWNGNPFAAIIRGARITGSAERLPIGLCGIPEDVMAMLSRLTELYKTLEPEIIKESTIGEEVEILETITVAGEIKTIEEVEILETITVAGEIKGMEGIRVTEEIKLMGEIKAVDKLKVEKPKCTGKSKLSRKSKATPQPKARVSIIEKLKASETNKKRRIEEITRDDDESTCDNTSVHTNQTAHSYDTRLSRAIPQHRQQLASIAESSLSGKGAELDSTPWFRKDKKRKFKVGAWVEGTGSTRLSMKSWLIPVNKK